MNANDQLYKQCTLKDKATNGLHVAWIKNELAVVGSTVSFKDEDGNFFIVEKINGETTLPWSEINDRSQDYKRTREASDI